MVLIGLCGKMGCGKDFLANRYIIPFIEKTLQQRCMKFSFADQIKVNVMTKGNIAFDDVFTQKTEVTRSLLQEEGTESGRNVYGKDIWVDYHKSWSKVFESRGVQNIITCDVRFKNEIDYIRNANGILIKVVAPTRNQARLEQETQNDVISIQKIKQHESERDLDDVDDSVFDVVMRNDTDSSDLKNDIAKLQQLLKQKLQSN
jgi:phosphomevalonate kinase